ncbi:hypothetical protein F66182_4784 [Fusarium sp. NRRL 66182]|nr:hypothetical protein F66182_4784 [Fusarium sp. NRRL 66182]
MATSTEQYRQYAPPSNYPAQEYQQQQFHQTASISPRRTSQNPPAHHRTFSFHSQKSHKSSGSKDLQETHAEKEAKRLHSKADPTLAISEAEPSAIAAMMTESSFAPLRSMQHKDSLGNNIEDPDKSNPTRNRWERPLDTIRSFEAAIDGGYSRKSLYRAETDSQANWNRRNSSFTNQPRFPRDHYYGGRPASFRPENTQFDLGPSRSNYFDGQAYSNGYGTGPSRQRMSRMQTEPQYQNKDQNGNVYPLPHKDRSYETVTSAAGSGNSDQAGYQTDPTSSDNSSIDRTMPAKRREPFNEYASSSYQPQQLHESRPWPASGVNGNGGQPQAPPPSHAQPVTIQAPAAAPQKQKNTLLRRTSTQQSAQQAQQAGGGDKRKSWFSRRFSKNS